MRATDVILEHRTAILDGITRRQTRQPNRRSLRTRFGAPDPDTDPAPIPLMLSTRQLAAFAPVPFSLLVLWGCAPEPGPALDPLDGGASTAIGVGTSSDTSLDTVIGAGAAANSVESLIDTAAETAADATHSTGFDVPSGLPSEHPSSDADNESVVDAATTDQRPPASPAIDSTGHGSSHGGSSGARALAGLEGLSQLRVVEAPTVPGERVRGPDTTPALRPDDDSLTHDFGLVLEGELALTEFILRNQSDGPVAVRAINSTCKCTLGDLFVLGEDDERRPYELDAPIAPGERLAVRAELETALQRGVMSHSVTLVPTEGYATRLSLKARVQPFLAAEPPTGTIQIGSLRREESRSGSLLIRATNHVPVELSIESAEVAPYVHPTLVPLDDDDADGRATRWRLDVTVGPDLPEIARRPWGFNVYSDVELPGGIEPLAGGVAPRYSQRVVLSATVLPSVRVQPNIVAFGVFAPDKDQEAVVEIEITDDYVIAAAPIVSIEWGLGQADPTELAPFLSTRLVALDEGTNWRLEVTLAGLPPELSGPFQGQITFATDHPERPKVVVPFSGLCRDRASGTSK